MRTADNVKPKRAELCEDYIINYFKNLGETLHGAPPENIFNFDERNFTDDPDRKNVFEYVC